MAGIEGLVIEISLSISTITADAGSASRNKFSALRLNVELGYAGASGGSCTCVS
jgi:hypothetical protein